MGLNGVRASRLLVSASALLLLSACAVKPRPFTAAEMTRQAGTDWTKMFSAQAPLKRPLTLASAIARALKYNLDDRTKMMEQALALGQTDLDRWDLLPKLAASAGYAGRSDHATTTSRDALTLQPAISDPYYSLDRDRLTANLGLSWNILDFGVSYFNAHENADRALIAEELRRKTTQNLVQQVRYDYWRAVAAQTLEPSVKKAVANAEQALADARRVETANLKNPAQTLRFEKTLLENLRQLEVISQDLSTAKVQLAALINLPPGTDFTLAVPADAAMTPPPFSIPMKRMEEIAFVNNPDLRQQGYLSRIAIDETKKTLARMLPGIDLSTSRQWDSNSFLVGNQWYEASARVSWNLFNVLSLPDQMKQAHAAEKVAEARRLAVRMAVLAQVHVAYLQFRNAEEQFHRDDQLYQVEQRLETLSDARSSNDAQGVLEAIGNQTSAIAASLRRYQSYAQVEQALGRIYATMGEDLLPSTLPSDNLAALTSAVSQGLTRWNDGAETAVAAAPPVASAKIKEAKAAAAGPGPARRLLHLVAALFHSRDPAESAAPTP